MITSDLFSSGVSYGLKTVWQVLALREGFSLSILPLSILPGFSWCFHGDLVTNTLFLCIATLLFAIPILFFSHPNTTERKILIIINDLVPLVALILLGWGAAFKTELQNST